MSSNNLADFAHRYTAAWCSHDATRVASCYAEDGRLTINDGEPSVGRAAIAVAAQAFMSDFPDMVVSMDDLTMTEEGPVYNWTLTGTYAGPAGNGCSLRISGCERWTMDDDGLIASSLGYFDEAEYRRQLEA
jgi:steroid delta-isomerase-like uncharacterized protein